MKPQPLQPFCKNKKIEQKRRWRSFSQKVYDGLFQEFKYV